MAAVLDGKICTIKVEVFFSSVEASSESVSGSLPLVEYGASKNGGKKVGYAYHLKRILSEVTYFLPVLYSMLCWYRQYFLQ